MSEPTRFYIVGNAPIGIGETAAIYDDGKLWTLPEADAPYRNPYGVAAEYLAPGTKVEISEGRIYAVRLGRP